MGLTDTDVFPVKANYYRRFGTAFIHSPPEQIPIIEDINVAPGSHKLYQM
ncbi:MAG: hypothetical protein KJZ78_00610 [Bryobacteraceae bacterium]|nr:hypothetical protein [Bryobacteraceae bacterium]